MNWSLSDSMQQTIPQGGGIAQDIAGLSFTGRTLPAIKQRIHDYVATMRLVNKPVDCVRVTDDEYSKLVRGVAKVKGLKDSEVFGLRHDGIPVVSMSAR